MRKALLLFIIFSGGLLNTQTQEIDSLKLRLKRNIQTDTIRVIDLNELGWQYLDYSADSSQKYVSMALKLANNLGYLNGAIEAKNAQGILYRYANESDKAIGLYEEIIRLRKEQGRLDRLTGAYSNLGSVYYEKNDYAKALNYYLKALDNATVFQQTDNQMVLMNNIGSAYKASGLSELAIETFKKGLELNKSHHDEYQEAQLYVNLATVYDQQGLYSESTKYNKDAYAIFKKTGNTRQLSVVLNNLSLSLRHLKDFKGTEEILKEMQELADFLKEEDYYASLYQSRTNYLIETQKYSEALREIERSLALTDTINELPAYASRLLTKSEVYQKLKEYSKAMECCDRGLAILQQLDDTHKLGSAYLTKSEIYQAVGDFKASLFYYQKADHLSDSLTTEALTTKMVTINSLNELDKKEKELQLSIKEKESMEVKNKQQSFFLFGISIIGVLVLVLLLFSMRAYRVKKKDNELLSAQKVEIQSKNKALEERQIEIEGQKLLIEEKQKEILDSIHYAKRIQNTLLANHELINRNLKENFILFKPKDIVSGDFYWAVEKKNYFYLAVCDSTGHGVPGAFMSLLNISFLNEAIIEKDITAPNEVLNHVRQKLISSVSQDGGQDGMDCVLVCFDKKSAVITYAAAQNRLLLVRDSELIEFPTDKMPVGKGENLNSFTLHTIHPRKGDLLYLYSDGYADQFGGEKGKKFKYKALNELLLENSNLALTEQEKVMDSNFEKWKGKLEQVDDVVLIGIRL
jgi:serine phosphatase RsbU (regulator of sigma subunit)